MPSGESISFVMLKGRILRAILILVLLISTSTYACIPCDDETTLLVVSQAKPKFSKSYRSDDTFGQVTFKVDVNAHAEITKFEILQLTPIDLPENVITEMIKKSAYRLASDKKDHATCSVKDFELTFEFDVPKKLEFELDLGL